MGRISEKRQYNSTAVGFPIRYDQRANENGHLSGFSLASVRARMRVYENFQPFSLERSLQSLPNFLDGIWFFLCSCFDSVRILRRYCVDIAWIVYSCALRIVCGSLGSHLQGCAADFVVWLDNVKPRS